MPRLIYNCRLRRQLLGVVDRGLASNAADQHVQCTDDYVVLVGE